MIIVVLHFASTFSKKMERTEPPSGKSAHTDFPLQPVDHLLLVESTVDRPLQG